MIVANHPASQTARLGNAIERWTVYLLGALMIAMVALNVANAIGRYAFGHSLGGADEIMVFSMVWLVFLGMPLIACRGEHLRFSFLEQKLAPRPALFLKALLDLYVAVLCGYVAVYSSDFVERIIMINQKSMAGGIPMVIPHSALLIALIATAVVCGCRAAVLFRQAVHISVLDNSQ